MERMPKAMVKMSWILLFIVMTFQHFKTIDAIKYRGDKCSTKGRDGECKEWSQCPTIKTLIENGEYTTQEVLRCGFTVYEEVICCPIEKWGFALPNRTRSQRSSNGERPAAKACRRIEDDLSGEISIRIDGGTPSSFGDFPHMAAIGFRQIGSDNRKPYEFLCGGSLIDKRFVLTAAHCVEVLDYEPVVVRLGVNDFSDPLQMSQAIEIKIKEIHEHPEYNIRYKYNDIAILELERDVETTVYVNPVCLYTNETDPDPETELWIAGWGVSRSSGASVTPSILMKGRVYTTPKDQCNKIFQEYGNTRPIPQGITHTIFCAEDRNLGVDACQGDSGGPLNLVVDKDTKNYRLVGIVNAGISCAGSTPGLYTKVAAFLNFIENIVWPNGVN